MSIEGVNQGLDTNYSQAFNDLAIANEERPVGSENRLKKITSILQEHGS